MASASSGTRSARAKLRRGARSCLRRLIRPSLYGRQMRLIVARCEVSYLGRLTTVLPEAVRLLMLKADGTFMVWADGGGPSVKPLNWMTPPTVIEESDDRLVVRKRGGASEDRLEIAISETLSDVCHEMGTPADEAGLAKDGVEV